MKHTLKITILLVLIFILAQVVGLAIINQYINIGETKRTGKTVVNEGTYNITGLSPPTVENESYSWIYIMGAVLFGTVLVLLIVRFRKRRLWKLWFFLSVITCLTVALAPFVEMIVKRIGLAQYALLITILISGILSIYKIFKPNVYVHNLTEIFIYGGLAALIVPIINTVSAVALLIAISLYDMYAVWHSKHMVTMAKFQAKSRIFAGLMINYEKQEAPAGQKRVEVTDAPVAKRSTHEKGTAKKARSAILGGGDIAFPLLFSGVVMKTTASYISPLIVTVFAAASLLTLFMIGKSNRFYPAMPFISAGCFIGFGVVKMLALAG